MMKLGAQPSMNLTQGVSYLHTKAAGFVYMMKLGAQAFHKTHSGK